MDRALAQDTEGLSRLVAVHFMGFPAPKALGLECQLVVVGVEHK
jgi:hypothetical protein